MHPYSRITSFLPGLLVALALSFLAGCQNPYSQFYTNNIPPNFKGAFYPHSGEPMFFSVNGDADGKASVERLVRSGYVMIGSASFEGPARDYGYALRAKAAEVQADIVLVSQAYARTMNGVLPITTYHPGQPVTTYSTGQVSATAYGSGGTVYGSGTYSGTSTTYTPGTTTTNFVPYQVQRNSYSAGFFRKRYYIAGWQLEPLSDSERQALQRNTGMKVRFPVEGTPVFRANILPGDILVALDGEPLVSEQDISDRTLAKAGQTVKVTVLRGGAEKTIEVVFNPLPNFPPPPAKQ